MRSFIAFMSLILLAGAAHGQDRVRRCLDGDDQGNGLELVVDAVGDLHLSRVARVGGDLLYTRIGPDGVPHIEEVADRISRLATDEVTNTGLLVEPDLVAICFYNATNQRFEVASKTNGGAWVRETLAEGYGAGRSCDIKRYKGKLTVAFSINGTLEVASKGAAGWSRSVADDGGANEVGADASLAIDGANLLAIAHRNTTTNRLRITWYDRGWQTAELNVQGREVGWSPAPLFTADGQLVIYHGAVPVLPDQSSDQAIFETRGRLGGGYLSGELAGFSVGGSVDAVASAGQVTVFTRQRQRSALFGDADALHSHTGPLDGNLILETLEQSLPGGRRHQYQYTRVGHDPFGLGVYAFLDDVSATFTEPAGAPVCYYRPGDTDGDRLPDSVEADLGTDPNRADTDGDGRGDGDEVLVDGTDPLVSDHCDAAPEVCDGVDNDCDQAIDEDLSRACYPADPATEGVGPCHEGAEGCVGGDWGACVGAVTPTVERCNGADDDCDGQTDEGNPDGGAFCDTGLAGRCADGEVRCADGVLGCEALVPAVVEACNDEDDDCDGAVDEGTQSCGVGACAREVPICVDGQDNICTPGAPAANDATCDDNDDDCDGQVDEDFGESVTRCGVGACAAEGRLRCVAGVVDNTCQAGAPAVGDATCDGVDDDCDGQIDEDFLPGDVICGVGACARPGFGVCVDGVLVGDCEPGQPAADDATCDGVDDDCDGRADEDFAAAPTTCGVGLCASVGQLTCMEAQVIDTCFEGQPAPDDATCDGVDDDCDGQRDDDFEPAVTACGVGVCAAAGIGRCVDGLVESDCQPSAPIGVDDNCDGRDDDCDGTPDDAFAEAPTNCGVGACAASGVIACVAGAPVDDCTPGQPAPNDATCDGIDDDCDGQIDEDYRPQPIECGVGACASRGVLACVGGRTVEACEPGQAADEDATCDNIDDDCDGQTDEDHVAAPTVCGVGACASAGMLTCLDGQLEDSCFPQLGAPNDATCDDIDDDCDGVADEDYRGPPTRCGVGACEAAGALRCVDGLTLDDCAPLPAAQDDITCDDIDDDCDGQVDEDYPPTPTHCGGGVCAADGVLSCSEGRLTDSCEAGVPAPQDLACDGFDDDCDGQIDEDFIAQPTTCGVGACAREGATRCEDALIMDSCLPGPSAPDDATCNAVDDDCDGLVDEDAPSVATRCGVGACAATGQLECVDGGRHNTCEPGLPAPDDRACDGIDDDCDGATDEDFRSQATVCGVGACATEGATVCTDGDLSDTCTPGQPAATDDTCDGVDDDCDGEIDEDYQPSATACGVGACAAVGTLRCLNGQEVNDCAAGPPSPNDTLCDGIDADCDGQTDEDFLPQVTRCGEGACANSGRTQCVGGLTSDTCEPFAPAAVDDTVCDGLDADCDGMVDEDFVEAPVVCGIGACAADGHATCLGGVIGDTCVPGQPAQSDPSCDGVDDDCDGQVDEDFQAQDTTCGVGACADVGRLECQLGHAIDSCQVGQAALVDNTCDGADDDCDGQTDEDYQARTTDCGVGACAAEGTTACEAGLERDSCAPTPPAADDPTCDGVDDDCDGAIDEDYAAGPTSCGVGACTQAGQRACVAGAVTDSCVPAAPAADDSTCDGADDDCDGQLDEDYQARALSCGEGACARIGQTICVEGAEAERCQAGAPAVDDSTCDGEDDDCDGAIDEDVISVPTQCGVGACAAAGERRCAEGALVDTCSPGRPGLSDRTCDNIDDDCDGEIDEEVQPTGTRCGVGACDREGQRACVDGALRDDCTPGAPLSEMDETCDDVDDDCDGATDEDTFPEAITCGDGVCMADGLQACRGGVWRASCTPSQPFGDDDNCDGLDDDCDGEADEGFSARASACGVGVCAAAGEHTCQDGEPLDTCIVGAGAQDDATCDGLDDDCDGAVDEDYPNGAITCGQGACQRDGAERCEAGEVQTDCAPGQPAADDTTCDGVDDDCDGQIDEDAAPHPTSCGVGACASEGLELCEAGAWLNGCNPGLPAMDDITCDGRDDDCDGITDEDYEASANTCGLGACAAIGETFCDGGVEVVACEAGLPAVEDPSCDGVDDDCDGEADEDYRPRSILCGVGACARQVSSACVEGFEIADCVPGAPEALDDRTCDGIDDDCDGVTDEDCDDSDGGPTDGGIIEDAGETDGEVSDAEPDAERDNADLGDDGIGGLEGDGGADACLNEDCASIIDHDSAVADDGCDCSFQPGATGSGPTALLLLLASLGLRRRRRR